jgi:hypothetical protein
MVTEIRKTPMLPNTRDDAINSLIVHSQGSMGYAEYTHQLNELFRRSRHTIMDDFQCVIPFIHGIPNVLPQTKAK